MRMAIAELALPLQAAALSPLLWGLIYLGATRSTTYFGLAVLFALAFYAVLQFAYHKYYHGQAATALSALQTALDAKYELSSADPMEFIGDVDPQLTGNGTNSLEVVVVSRPAHGQIPPFLNYRAYLQPQGIFKSLVLVSRETSAQRFFLLHELGHLSPTSHHNALYDSAAALRLAVIYGPFLCLSPSLLVGGLILVAVFADWFFRGALRREYIADAFAWSTLSRTGHDVKMHARRMAAVFRLSKPRDDYDEIELRSRAKLCQTILDTNPNSPNSNRFAQDDRWIKENFITRFGAGLYANTSTFLQLITTIAAVWQFDGQDTRIAIFLLLAMSIATTLRLHISTKSWPAYRRLGLRLTVLPTTPRPLESVA